ncbi:MAG: DUF4395 domain-containing protein [Actinomycetota bacterium]|nr:DUF4395 domain-containing protein [Actinomycetota bacterium]
MNGARVQKAPTGPTEGQVDSHLPRFSQALVALLVALAFLLDARPVVPVLALVLAAASVGGPRANLFAYLYRVSPLPRGRPEPARPPRFAQTLGAVFLTVATIGLFALERDTTSWWALGWGPALLVAVLAGLAATTGFCLGCEIYLLISRRAARAR